MSNLPTAFRDARIALERANHLLREASMWRRADADHHRLQAEMIRNAVYRQYLNPAAVRAQPALPLFA